MSLLKYFKKTLVPSSGRETASAGDERTGSAGDERTGSAGDERTGSAGDERTGTAGDERTGSAGDERTGSAGDERTGSAGDERTGSAGDERTGSAGDERTGSAGDERTGSAGDERTGSAASSIRELSQTSSGNIKILLNMHEYIIIHVFNADTNLTGFDDSVELSSSGTEDKTVCSSVDDLRSTGPLAKRPALMDITEIASFVGSKPISSDSKYQLLVNHFKPGPDYSLRAVLDVHFSINGWYSFLG